MKTCTHHRYPGADSTLWSSKLQDSECVCVRCVPGEGGAHAAGFPPGKVNAWRIGYKALAGRGAGYYSFQCGSGACG